MMTVYWDCDLSQDEYKSFGIKRNQVICQQSDVEEWSGAISFGMLIGLKQASLWTLWWCRWICRYAILTVMHNQKVSSEEWKSERIVVITRMMINHYSLLESNNMKSWWKWNSAPRCNMALVYKGHTIIRLGFSLPCFSTHSSFYFLRMVLCRV